MIIPMLEMRPGWYVGKYGPRTGFPFRLSVLGKSKLQRISSWVSPEPLGTPEPRQEQVPPGAQAWFSFTTGLGAMQLAQGHDLGPNWGVWFLSLCLLL